MLLLGAVRICSAALRSKRLRASCCFLAREEKGKGGEEVREWGGCDSKAGSWPVGQ